MEPLIKFVAKDDDPRDYLRETFRVDQYAVGTDGSSLVFRELRDEDEWSEFNPLPEHKNGIEQAIRRFIGHTLAVKEWREFPTDFDRPHKDKLIERETCDECNGDRIVEWSTCQNDYEADCKGCDGRGSTRVDLVPAEILGKNFNFKLVSRFIDEKNLRINMEELADNDYGRLFFQFGEFGEYKGLILGLRL